MFPGRLTFPSSWRSSLADPAMLACRALTGSGPAEASTAGRLTGVPTGTFTLPSTADVSATWSGFRAARLGISWLRSLRPLAGLCPVGAPMGGKGLRRRCGCARAAVVVGGKRAEAGPAHLQTACGFHGEWLPWLLGRVLAAESAVGLGQSVRTMQAMSPTMGPLRRSPAPPGHHRNPDRPNRRDTTTRPWFHPHRPSTAIVLKPTHFAPNLAREFPHRSQLPSRRTTSTCTPATRTANTG